MNNLFESGLRELGIKFSDCVLQKFSLYLKELQKWNEKVNLTGIRDKKEIIIKHFLDSLSCALGTDDLSSKSGIDIGTGAGFPGIPLKIIYSDFRITLLDSSIKKIKFLEHIVKILKLTDVEVLYGRAEDFAKKEYREKYDFVFARAIAKLPVLIEICLPFVKIGGIFIAQKSDYEKELKKSEKVLNIIGGRLKEIKEINVPFLDAKRFLIIIEKEKSTPLEFPRRAGIPQKRPIL